MIGQFGQRFEVAGVGQLVDIDDAPVAFRDQQPDQRRTDESGAAGDKYGFQFRSGSKMVVESSKGAFYSIAMRGQQAGTAAVSCASMGIRSDAGLTSKIL
jgi:hypothetical protein